MHNNCAKCIVKINILQMFTVWSEKSGISRRKKYRNIVLINFLWIFYLLIHTQPLFSSQQCCQQHAVMWECSQSVALWLQRLTSFAAREIFGRVLIFCSSKWVRNDLREWYLARGVWRFTGALKTNCLIELLAHLSRWMPASNGRAVHILPLIRQWKDVVVS